MLEILATAADHDDAMEQSDRLMLRWVWGTALYRAAKYKEAITVLRELAREKSGISEDACELFVRSAIGAVDHEKAKEALVLWDTSFDRPRNKGRTAELREQVRQLLTQPVVP